MKYPRYHALLDGIQSLLNNNNKAIFLINVEQILQKAMVSSTLHSVIVKPDKRRWRVAFSQQTDHAAGEFNWIEFEWDDLMVDVPSTKSND